MRASDDPERRWYSAARLAGLQRIKNELVDPEAEAVELFPAESRLVDTANHYHLWVFPEYRFPFGMQTREVSGPQPGLDQRER